MSKDQAAGDLTAGKDEKLPPDELSAKARRAKLTRRATVNEEQIVEATAAKTEDKQQDDFYFDALLRFGIQI